MHSLQRMRFLWSLNLPISLNFTNVVDQGKQFPLDIHLGFGAQGKVIQAFVCAEVRKDGLDDRQSSSIDLPACRCVEPGFHLFDQAGLLTLYLNRQIPAGCIRLAQTSGSQRAAGTIFLAGAINIIDPVTVGLVASIACQDFALWTTIALL